MQRSLRTVAQSFALAKLVLTTLMARQSRLKHGHSASQALKQGVEKESQAYKDLVMELDILTKLTGHPNVVEFVGADIGNPKQPIGTGPCLDVV